MGILAKEEPETSLYGGEYNPLPDMPQMAMGGDRLTVKQKLANRLKKKFAEGGLIDPVDPPKNKPLTSDERMNKYNEEKQFVKDWFQNPITMNKFIDKRFQAHNDEYWLTRPVGKDRNDFTTETYWDVVKGLSNLDKTTISEERSYGSNTQGDYKDNKINIYKGLFSDYPKGTAAHESSHAMGLDKELSKYVQKEVGYLQLSDDDMPNERSFKKYLNRGEVFPRIMSIRYQMGLKPGDTVTTEDIENFKKDNKEEIFRWYDTDQVKDLLNKSVDASDIKNDDLASNNDKKDYSGMMALGGPKQNDMNELLSEINTGGSHAMNPNGGVPIGNGNTVEQGETMTKDYVFSDRLFLSEPDLKRYNLPKKLKGKSIADASKILAGISKESNAGEIKGYQRGNERSSTGRSSTSGTASGTTVLFRW